MVIMDRQDYINKYNNLLNQPTYRAISQDPTNTIKNKLINILEKVKNQTDLDSVIYKLRYTKGCVSPKFYGLPKIHKLDTPLRPIVSSCGSVTYGVAKELTKILKPLVGMSPHHINSTHDLVEQVKQFTLAPGECLSSYDVSDLFTSVPVDPALGVIKDLLEKGPTLKDRKILPVKEIILLLEFCLTNTYFSLQDQFYEQVKGAAMGSPVSPIVANLYMEYFEQKSLSTAIHPPGFGKGMWMTPLSSRRKSTNRISCNTLTVLTLPSSLQWRTIRRMVPSPSWTPLLMGICLSLCTGNLLTQTSTYSGTVTTTSQQSLVLSTPWPIGPILYVAILSFSTSGRHLHNANIPNGLWTGWRKGWTSPPDRLLMGLTARAPQVPSTLPMKLNPRVTLIYLPHKVSVKVSRRSVGGMVYRSTSKVVIPSGTYWSPPRTKTLWSTKVEPYIGFNVVISPVMMNI